MALDGCASSGRSGGEGGVGGPRQPVLVELKHLDGVVVEQVVLKGVPSAAHPHHQVLAFQELGERKIPANGAVIPVGMEERKKGKIYDCEYDCL